jgi:hypothetical protein
MATLRYQIERSVALLLNEPVDRPGWQEPMWLREAVIDACDEVAERDAYWGRYTLSTTGSTGTPMSSVCLPRQLYKLKRVTVTLANGSKVELLESRDIYAPGMASRLWPDWRTAPVSGGTPQGLILTAPDAVIYPRPNWTGTNNLLFEGFATPGANWANDAGGAITANDPFPLEEWARRAVVYCAARARCIQDPSPNNQIRFAMINDKADEFLGWVQAQAATAYQRGTLQGRTP